MNRSQQRNLNNPRRGLVCLSAVVGLTLLLVAQLAGQDKNTIDVTAYVVSVQVDIENHALKGQSQMTFRVKENTTVVPVEINNFLSVQQISDQNGKAYPIRFDDLDNNKLLITSATPWPGGSEQTLKFQFEGVLEKQRISFGESAKPAAAFIDDDEAFLMSAGKWFPVHRFPLDEASMDVSVAVPLGFSVVSSGKLAGVDTKGNQEIFRWVSSGPIDRVSVAVGRFGEKSESEGPIQLRTYLNEEYRSKETELLEQSKKILRFYNTALGPYRREWLALVQLDSAAVDERANAGLVFVTEKMLKSRNLDVTDLARRIAYQWWGFDVHFARSRDAWLSDGFAYYSAALYLKTVDEDLYRTEMARLATLALKYEKKAPIAQGLQIGYATPEYESIVAGKGAWVLQMLRALVGDEVFATSLRQFATNFSGKAATTEDFAATVRAAGYTKDLDWFFAQWIDSIGIPEMQVDYTVYKLKTGLFKVSGKITQPLDLFRMPLDVRVETKGKQEDKTVNLVGKTTSFTLTTETKPVKIIVDPDGKILKDSDDMKIAVQIALGKELFDAGSYVESIREYEKAIRIDPRSSLAHFRLGEVFFEQSNTSSAANSFRDALNGDLKPKWTETWSYIYLGKIFDILGQRQRALAEYQKALNTKDDTLGAQAEAEKWVQTPFKKEATIIG